MAVIRVAVISVNEVIEWQTPEQFQLVGYHLAIYRRFFIPTPNDDALQRRNAINSFRVAAAFKFEIENPEINKIGV